jgi:hypothetical protein
MKKPSQTQGSECLITRQGLASRWSYSPKTLRRKEQAGELPVLKIGRAVRYRLSDIERIEREAEVSL